ncbi:YihY/virulence factor BrkB family protein [Bacteroides sp. 224]|uniref:YihY/virulence factor BrkB family protein n=1 Tax=Bacteroides sp. 224 TaxID=2302936 RepID=UPI0013D7E44A|nr:YihY/virulence factor BrkB family protein [Bacteroides sp. 224]NDV66856.1 YihY/virulence factor BrkB family protein [Bacteroides sp. 224]
MKDFILRILNFLTNDIWRITEDEVTKKRFSLYTVIKTAYLTADHFTKDRIVDRASALTYSSLLAVVPILAILFAIARGFGFENLIESQLIQFSSGVNYDTKEIMGFVDNYLKEAKSGVFLGVGLIMLLWSVVNLTSNIENTFNRIWQVKKPRSMYRKITDYFSMFLLLPIVLVLSGTISIFVSTQLKGMAEYIILAPFYKFLITSIPFVFTWLMFTALYIFMPNTKVKFKSAFIAGVLAGSVFQIFQYIYISGQLWVTKYNAIYGSFAAIPLFLLWLQMSWTICLLGVELAYASQNVHSYNFENDTRKISRRYRDFISILILSLIAKRFEKNETPYTAEKLSEAHHIPITLTNQVLYHLQDLELIHEVMTDEKSEEITYQPSIDINQLTLAFLVERIDTYGSENFKIDHDQTFAEEWKTLINLKEEYYRNADKILLKDL